MPSRGLFARGLAFAVASFSAQASAQQAHPETVDTTPVPGLWADWRISENVSLFARLDNVFDTDYETLGAFNRNVFDAEGPVSGRLGTIERFVSPGHPRALFVGVRLSYATQPPKR